MKTFVVRIWFPLDVESPPSAPDALHGLVELPDRGSAPVAFRSDDELVAVLKARLAADRSMDPSER